ncbi:glycoside hydrolase [Rickenella mellea]|uniref:alpha-L-fucosidase n=1 Tax=Rickenella mellea TaxID=50990 RepID=A0A4Y7Q8I0_9AGAM|nr:glycoside hydrolase [Rickenella mellea]
MRLFSRGRSLFLCLSTCIGLSVAASPKLAFTNVRSTTKLADETRNSTTNNVQYFEVTLGNTASQNSTSAWLTTPHTVEIISGQVSTVIPGQIKRLAAGQSTRILVGVQNSNSVGRGTAGTAKAVLKDATGTVVTTSASFNVTAGIPVYTSSSSSLGQHESPSWYDNAKFGIFVHWGVYAVPAYALVGKQYAEWYWWDMTYPNNKSSPTWTYHQNTYGKNVKYDDFIQNFTASNFQAKDLVDLFAASGAKYFVQVSKHHDGFAIFDTKNTSNRNSVQMGPKRDLLKEILDAAKQYHPELRRGTYFSLPEWFHPDYTPYKIRFPCTYGSLGKLPDGTTGLTCAGWSGGPAPDPFDTTQTWPYTGYVKSPTNYIVDVQGPQMEMLMNQYETEILWCDIGGANEMSSIAPAWFNNVTNQGRSVLINNRCGLSTYDITTPEYTTYAATTVKKWESNEGLDPFSYGYNAQTQPSQYKTPTQVIHSLVDITSKNGNYLLDIGPKADGTVAQPMVDTLTSVGDWLAQAGPAIYNTQYWAYNSSEGANLRFTTTTNAFYIISFAYPDPTNGIVITSPIPIVKGDTVKLLGGSGAAIPWTGASGSVTLKPPKAESDLVQYAWAFQVNYQ